MLRYMGKRVLHSLLVLFIITIIAFSLIRLAPGSPVEFMLPMDVATPEQIVELEARLGLDKPYIVQYFHYMVNLFRGDLGTSLILKRPVLTVILQRLPNSGVLAFWALITGTFIALPLGIIAGTRRGKLLDLIAVVFALVGQSISQMWLGIMLIYLFAVKLGWLPAMGTGGAKFIIMPMLTLALPMAATLTRVARSGIIDTLSEDYITTTYARGVGKFQVYTRYALRNAIIPFMTMLAINLGGFLAGSVVTETIFSWSGIGGLMQSAVGSRDYPIVQALLLISAAFFAIINLIMDIINSIIDPRLTLG